jgi:hypothetical protein
VRAGARVVLIEIMQDCLERLLSFCLFHCDRGLVTS